MPLSRGPGASSSDAGTPGGSQPSDALTFSQSASSPRHAQEGAAGASDAGAKVIWGTNVSIAETMQLFRAFLRGFRLKYRWAYARSLGIAASRPADADGDKPVSYTHLTLPTNREV